MELLIVRAGNRFRSIFCFMLARFVLPPLRYSSRFSHPRRVFSLYSCYATTLFPRYTFSERVGDVRVEKKFFCTLVAKSDDSDVQSSLEKHSAMIKANDIPSNEEFNKLIQKLVKEKMLTKALIVFRQMTRVKRTTNAETFYVLVNGFCEDLKVEKAMQVMEYEKQHGVTATSDTFHSIIHCFCKLEEMEKALQGLEQMVKRETKINRETFVCVIEALCKKNQVMNAMKIFSQMIRLGGSMDISIANTMMRAYDKTGQFRTVEMMYDEVKSRGLTPDIETYRLAFLAFYNEKNIPKALKVAQEMESSGASVPFEVSEIVNSLKK